MSEFKLREINAMIDWLSIQDEIKLTGVLPQQRLRANIIQQTWERIPRKLKKSKQINVKKYLLKSLNKNSYLYILSISHSISKKVFKFFLLWTIYKIRAKTVFADFPERRMI